MTEELAAFAALCERPGLTVFVGRREKRGSTDVMAGKPPEVPWFRAIHCIGDDHWVRAAHFVNGYKTRKGDSDAKRPSGDPA